jgi:hypothetical protein
MVIPRKQALTWVLACKRGASGLSKRLRTRPLTVRLANATRQSSGAWPAFALLKAE